MIYLCFDTNVFIKVLLDNYKKESHYENIDENTNFIIHEIKSLISSGQFLLMLPEVIELELEKENLKIEESICGSCKKVDRLLDDALECIWNESYDLIDKLKKNIEIYENEKISIWGKCFEQLIELFKNDNTLKLNLTPETICQTEKRKIKGLITEKQINDSYIIDSIYNFIQENLNLNIDEVYFITYDKGFFSGETIRVKYCQTDLKINILFGLDQFEKKINLNFSFYENDNLDTNNDPSEPFIITDEWFAEVAQQTKETYEHLVIEKEKQIIKQPQSVQSIRIELLKSINNKLAECRKLETWDNRSELKLWQWLECRSEVEIPLSSISDLCNISKNIDEYNKVHREMQNT